MARQIDTVRRNAVLLRDDMHGVATEDKPRKIQGRPQNGGFDCSLNPEWLDLLELAQQGEPTAHSMSLGVNPVIVQNPAIIVQPYDAVMEDTDEPTK